MPPRIISVATQKGGVGKTTIAVNLAGALAGHFGLKTYLADFDPQCNATQYILGDELSPQDGTIRDVLENSAGFEQTAILAPHSENLWIVPGSEELAHLDRLVAQAGKWEVALHEMPRLLRRSLPMDADVVIVDTPPSLGLWLQMALAISDDVVIAGNPEKFSLVGMRQLLETITQVRGTLNPRLNVAAVILNKVRSHTREHDAYVEAFRENFGSHVLRPVLPLRTTIPESQSDSVPLEFYGRAEKDARAFFRQLAQEIMTQVGMDARPRDGRAAV